VDAASPPRSAGLFYSDADGMLHALQRWCGLGYWVADDGMLHALQAGAAWVTRWLLHALVQLGLLGGCCTRWYSAGRREALCQSIHVARGILPVGL